MKAAIDNIARTASQIRTPLALSGFTAVLLYGLYRQVLSLDIFSKVGEHSTVALIGGILDKVFWLALVALILGVGSHLLSVILRAKPRRQASVELVDARVLQGDKPARTRGQQKTGASRDRN